MKTYRHTYNYRVYVIERDYESRGFCERTVKNNLNGTPRCRAGWKWYLENKWGDDSPIGWASSLGNAKAAIEGKETGDHLWS